MRFDVVRVIRSKTSKNGKMWTLVTTALDDDDFTIKINAFENKYTQERNTVGHFDGTPYESYIQSMQLNESLDWNMHPISIEAVKDGKFWKLTGVATPHNGEGCTPDDNTLIIQTNRQAAIFQAQSVFNCGLPVRVWDVETTGTVKLVDDIVSIAVCDGDRKPVIGNGSVKLRPSEANKSRLAVSSSIHGLTWDALKDEPAFPEHYESIKGALKNTVWVVYNQTFDPYMLWANCARYDLELIKPLFIVDAMEVAMDFTGSSKRVSLVDVSTSLGVVVKDAHDAFGDVVMTHGVLRAIADSV